jgi:hypothetical protein
MLLYWLWNRHIEQYADLRYVLRVLYSTFARFLLCVVLTEWLLDTAECGLQGIVPGANQLM